MPPNDPDSEDRQVERLRTRRRRPSPVKSSRPWSSQRRFAIIRQTWSTTVKDSDLDRLSPLDGSGTNPVVTVGDLGEQGALAETAPGSVVSAVLRCAISPADSGVSPSVRCSEMRELIEDPHGEVCGDERDIDDGEAAGRHAV
jgi:hypothetical protein